MPSVYTCNTIGAGLSAVDAFRPDVNGPYSCLMIHPVKTKALIASSVDNLTGGSLTKWLTGATWPDLRQLARTTSPTAPQRAGIQTFLSQNGYTALPANVTVWLDVIHFVARQVNSAADLDRTFC